MKRFAGLLAVGALIMTAAAAGARSSRMSHSTLNTEVLGKLVQANLGEVSNLSAELPSLKGHSSVERVWREMIRQHRNEAAHLAKLDRRAGGHPDTTLPTPQPATGTPREIVDQTLQAHRDTLQAVEGLEKDAKGEQLRALDGLEKIVQHHIHMIEGLNKGKM